MKRRVTISVLFVIIIIGVIFVSASAEAPRDIHLSWQNDPSNSITIMWRTNPDITESIVEYGLTSDYGESTIGMVHSYIYAKEEVVWHTVELINLLPNTTYHYRCGMPGEWSKDYIFTTAQEEDKRVSFKFAVFGDSRGGYDILADIFKKVKAEGVKFIIFTGDLTDGGSQYEYNKWFKAGEGIFTEIPLISVHGNHEGMQNTYFDQFAFPGNEKWFSFDYANIHFIFLLTISEPYVVEQRSWLLKDLRGNTKPWIIAIGHKPAYAADINHGSTQYIIDYWVDVFERYGVDLYFNGHSHNYERTWPIRDGQINADGVRYITTGAAGAPLVGNGYDWWTALSESTYHYIVVTVRRSQIKAVVKRLDGSILDNFTLNRF